MPDWKLRISSSLGHVAHNLTTKFDCNEIEKIPKFQRINKLLSTHEYAYEYEVNTNVYLQQNWRIAFTKSKALINDIMKTM